MWTIDEIVASNARKFGDRDAFVLGESRLGFAGLDREVTAAAAVFQAAGLERGGRVAVMGRNSLLWVVAVLGVIRAGGVVVPVNHKLAAPEVAFILGHCEASLWLFDGDFSGLAGAVPHPAGRFLLSPAGPEPSGVPDLSVAMRAGQAFRPVPLEATDPVEILYTSGTTGRPKGCVHSHAGVLLAGLSSSLVFALGQTDRILVAMPAWHAFPLNNLLFAGLYVGATSILMEDYHPARFLDVIAKFRCTVFFGPPIAYVMPLNTGIAIRDSDIATMRLWIYGAGPIDPETLSRLTRHYRIGDFVQVYGMTETGPSGSALLPAEHATRAGSIGRAAGSGCEIRLMRTPTDPAGPGEVGEIWMRSQSMMLGYFNDPVATRDAFQDGWYRTGDLARMDRDGYLFIVDRARDAIVTGGENVYSKEVEDVISAYPGIVEVAVVGRPHPDWGETIVALVVANGSLDCDALTEFCAARLARYKVPREIRCLDRLPRTPTGKIMKYALRAMVRSEAAELDGHANRRQ